MEWQRHQYTGSKHNNARDIGMLCVPCIYINGDGQNRAFLEYDYNSNLIFIGKVTIFMDAGYIFSEEYEVHN